jgi:hypothetical protein
MAQEKKYTPQHISDRIIQGYIDKLLGVGDEYKKEIKKVNPYSLDSSERMFFEAGFKHGVKPAPPATKKLKPASRSMFEYEIIRSVGDDIEVPQVIDTKLTKIETPGLVGDYYIKTILLRNLMSQFLYEIVRRPCKGGERLVAKFNVDTRLLEGSIFRIE